MFQRNKIYIFCPLLKLACFIQEEVIFSLISFLRNFFLRLSPFLMAIKKNSLLEECKFLLEDKKCASYFSGTISHKRLIFWIMNFLWTYMIFLGLKVIDLKNNDPLIKFCKFKKRYNHFFIANTTGESLKNNYFSGTISHNRLIFWIMNFLWTYMTFLGLKVIDFKNNDPLIKL